MELSVETLRVSEQATPTRSYFFCLMLRGLCARIGNWRRRRQAEQDLLALDDRLLKDIGVSRSDIAQAVRGQREYFHKPTYGQEF
jgi:uncharacterized protein YjiS (DUF1127 family)